MAADGVAIPRGIVIGPDTELDATACGLPLPAIAKPCWEGSSKGIRNKCLVENWADLESVVQSLRRDQRQPILVEEFIDGDELTVGMVGNDPPGIIGIMRRAAQF